MTKKKAERKNPKGAGSNTIFQSGKDKGAPLNDVRPSREPRDEQEPAVGESLTMDSIQLDAEARKQTAVSVETRSAKPPEITSLEGLLRFVYNEGGKKLTIPKSAYETIERKTKTLSAPDPALVLASQLTITDTLVSVPLRLLIHVDESDAPKTTRRRVLDCVTAALRAHPVFAPPHLQDVLSRSIPLSDDAIEELRLAIIRFSETAELIGNKRLTPVEQGRLWMNAATTLVYLNSIRTGQSFEEFVTSMYAFVWSAPRVHRNEEKARSAVADIRNTGIVQNIISVFHAKLTLANEEAVALDEKIFQLRKDVDSIQLESAEKSRQITEKDTEIRRLLGDVALLQENVLAQRELREVAQSHHLSDYELLRTRITRMLDEQTALLTDGLQALSNGRLTVTQEFMERVRDSLENQRRSLDRKDD